MRRALLLTLATAGITTAIWTLATPPKDRSASFYPYTGHKLALLIAQASGPPSLVAKNQRPTATTGLVAQNRGPTATTGLIAHGRTLFQAGCASCHGFNAQGVTNQGPSLKNAGALAADFYLSTGRMPLNNPDDPPVRSHPTYTTAEIKALTAYVGSLGGPPIPDVDPSKGTLAAGRKAFTEHCAGCHQVMARGGIVIGGIAPPLREASATQVAEAVRLGPYLMPRFTTKQIDDRTLSSIARYVEWASHKPDDRGGWGIGNIGPIPEGMVAWLIGIVVLLIVVRLIGERTAP